MRRRGTFDDERKRPRRCLAAYLPRARGNKKPSLILYDARREIEKRDTIISAHGHF